MPDWYDAGSHFDRVVESLTHFALILRSLFQIPNFAKKNVCTVQDDYLLGLADRVFLLTMMVTAAAHNLSLHCLAVTLLNDNSVATSPQRKQARTKSSASKEPGRKSSSDSPTTVSTLSEKSPPSEDDVSLESDVDSPAQSTKSSTRTRPSASAAQEILILKQRITKLNMGKSQEVKSLEKKLAKSDKNRADMQAELDNALGELEDTVSERDAIQARFDELLAKYKACMEKLSSMKSPDNEKNDGMVRMVRKMTRSGGWLKFKFLTSDKQLRIGSTIVMDLLKLKDCMLYDDDSEERTQEVELNRADWLNKYSTDVRAGNNEQRSYVQSEMKKIALQWMRDGKTLPTTVEFAKVARRDLDRNSKESQELDEEIFDMYVKMLSAASGSKYFGDKHRRTYPISKCKTTDNKVAVPPGTEAFVIVMYENCYVRWLNMHDFREVQKKKGNIPKYSSLNHDETKQWMGKYSDSCSGNSPYGGWSKEGIESFNAHSKVFKELRQKNSNSYREVEEGAMLRFAVAWDEERKQKRRDNGLEEEEDSAAASRKKKRARQDSEEDEVVAEFD